jgi:CSLREA domain-containing protein
VELLSFVPPYRPLRMRRRLDLVVAVGVATASCLSAATITVTSASDALAPDGVCSLREAMASAMNNAAPFPGTSGECAAGASGSDEIAFAIPGAGVHTITPAAPLPAISEPVIIDGYTQPGASPNTLAIGNNAVLRIEIDASSTDANGLFRIEGLQGGSVLMGLVVNRSPHPVVVIGSNGTPSQANKIFGNFFGTDPTGQTLLGDGPTSVVSIVAGFGTTIGGSSAALRNLFAGGGTNGGAQIAAGPASGSVTIQGNYFGTNASGTVALLPANGSNGAILLEGDFNLVGGDVGIRGNVIVAKGVAIRLSASADSNQIGGNRIGTNAQGTAGLGPGLGVGVQTDLLATVNNRIGASIFGGPAGNLISNQLVGLRIGSGSTLVVGNRLGTDVNGSSPIPNSIGIALNGASGPGGVGGAEIGGDSEDSGNVIAYSTNRGVWVAAGTGFRIAGNSLFGNGGLGIALSTPGRPTPNDPGDGDEGANRGQNYPEISRVDDLGGGVLSIRGVLDSAPDTSYRVELFASPACHRLGFGEGASFLGRLVVATDGSGRAAIGPLTVAAPIGQGAVTATAADFAGNTSELSPCLPIDGIFLDGFETGGTHRWRSPGGAVAPWAPLQAPLRRRASAETDRPSSSHTRVSQP